jgi:hypothetical protein
LERGEAPFLGAAFNLLHGRDLNFYSHFITHCKVTRISERRIKARDKWEVASLIFVPLECINNYGEFTSDFSGLLRECNRHLRAALHAFSVSGRLAHCRKQARR